MRCSVALAGWLMLVPVAVAQEEAQKLYEAMQQKLSKAKVHKVEFVADFQLENPGSGKGTLIVATGNRLHLTFDMTSAKRQSKGLWVCDGKTMVRKEDRDGKPFDNSVPVPSEKLFENGANLLTQGSLMLALEYFGRSAKPNDRTLLLKPSNFQALPKEKVGDREALVIAYKLSIADKEHATCRLWLDPQTHLPLKRILELTKDGRIDFRAEETFGRWEIDPKLPEGTFALPK